MEGEAAKNAEDATLDDLDEQLIQALTGHLDCQESNASDNDDHNHSDVSDCDDNLDFDWFDDGNDDDVALADDLDNAPLADDHEIADKELAALKEEINATRKKLAYLEEKLSKEESKRRKKNKKGRMIVEQGSENGPISKLETKQANNIMTAKKTQQEKKMKIEKKNEKKNENHVVSGEDQVLNSKDDIVGEPRVKGNQNNGSTNGMKNDADGLFKKKERMAHTSKHEPKMNRSGIDNINLEKKKINVHHKPKHNIHEKKDEREWRTEAYSGIRIINPRISSSQMDSKMDGRRFIKLNTLSRYIVKGEISGDWVTMAVVVGKLPPKTAANGKTFSIWRLSDLVPGHENETTAFFLFGDVYKEHWKVSEGTVIALLNSAIMPQRDSDSTGAVAMTLDNPKKLMIMGTSKDFGFCKGSTRKGNQCTYVVNKVHGEYCEYHVAREHKKTSAGRMELQSSSTGPDLKKGRLMQAVRKDISSGQVCYGGQTLTWSDKGQKKRKAETKKSILNAIVGSTLTSSSKENNENLSTNKKGRSSLADDDDDILSEDFKSRLKVPTVGSRNLLKFLKKDEEEEKVKSATTKQEVKSAKDLLNDQKMQNKKCLKPISLDLSATTTTKKPAPKFSASFKPTIGGSSMDDDFIEFCDSDDVISDALNSKSSCMVPDAPALRRPAEARRSSVDGNEAKLKAINLLRNKKIKIEQEKDRPKSGKKSPKDYEKIKERVLKSVSNQEGENCQPPKKKRKGILGEIFGEIDLKSDEGKKLIEMKSENDHLVRLAETEREQAYFNVLEKKEMYEDKMKNIMEMKVTAVCCKMCRYMHEFQSNYCKDQGHATVKVEATKRFFMCKNCKNRTTSFKKMPVQSCRNCGSSSFERTSMYQEKKGPKIGGETLLVRGEEHSVFLNSLK